MLERYVTRDLKVVEYLLRKKSPTHVDASIYLLYLLYFHIFTLYKVRQVFENFILFSINNNYN